MANIKILVVGGGGSGIRGASWSPGGGAGGMIYNAAFAVTSKSYPVTVGASDEDSVFDSLVAFKGGIGSGNGGGTGAGGAGTSGQGNAGGSGRNVSPYPPGGGGGAGSDGDDSAGSQSGYGGYGATSDISGSTLYYCGGGGGGGSEYGSTAGLGRNGGGNGGHFSSPTFYPGTAGAANTGSGGGGGGYTENKAAGGTGIVIVRYITADFGACIGGTITTDGLDTIHTFTENGTFEIPQKQPVFIIT